MYLNIYFIDSVFSFIFFFSRNASDLSAGDTLFLALLAEAIQTADSEPKDKSDLDVIIIEKDNPHKLDSGNF